MSSFKRIAGLVSLLVLLTGNSVYAAQPKKPHTTATYQQLREASRSHLNHRTGTKRWTDRNVHDPGLSLLHAMCYAITDLAYHTCAPGVSNFIGMYLGALVGGTRAHSAWTTTSLTSLGAPDPLVDTVKTMAATAVSTQVYLGLMLAGFNRVVAGFEAGWIYYNIRMDPGIPGTGAIGTAAVRANDSVSVTARYGASLRARVGYLVTPSVMAYVTGGPAWLWTRATVNCTTAGVCGTNGIAAYSQTNSQVLTGWTVGGGIETVLWKNWRGRIEYRHTDYGSFSTNFGAPAALAVGANIDTKMDSVMVGLAYAFGPGIVAR